MERKVYGTHYKYIADNEREVLIFNNDQLNDNRHIVFILKGYKYDDYVLYDNETKLFYDNVIYGYVDDPGCVCIGYDIEGFDVNIRLSYSVDISMFVPEIYDIMNDYMAERLIE